MKKAYIILCFLGTILPYWQFIIWLRENGLETGILINEIVALRLGSFAWLDVTISALVLLLFIFHEGRRLKMTSLWLPALGTLTVGVSLGLPLFLLLREIQLQNSLNKAETA